MKEFRVSFYMEVPDEVEEDDLEKWLKFTLGAAAQIKSATLSKIEGAEKDFTCFSVSPA